MLFFVSIRLGSFAFVGRGAENIMLKRVLVLFFLLLLLLPQHCSATEPEVLATETVVDKGGMFERAIADLVNNVFDAFYGKLEAYTGMQPLHKLLLENKENAYDLQAPDPYTPAEWQTLDRFYASMSLVVLLLGLLLVVITAYRFIYSGVVSSPEARAEAVSSLWRWLMVIMIIAAAPVIVRAVFVLNNLVVDSIKLAANLGDPAAADAAISGRISTGSVLLTAIVKGLLNFVLLQVNIVFWVRDWVIRVIYVFTPIMAILWGINKNVTAASVWLGEILTNAFLQSAYALALAVVVVFLPGEAPWPLKVVGAFMIPMLGNMLRNSLQGLWSNWAGSQEEAVAGKFMRAMGVGWTFRSLGRLGKPSPTTDDDTKKSYAAAVVGCIREGTPLYAGTAAAPKAGGGIDTHRYR
jgi:hypothetical protein